MITSIGGGAGPGFVGTIDEVRLWNRTRGEREIRAAKDHRLTGFEPGLVAYWRFDEATGELAADATELGNDGVVRGATWARSDAPVGDHPGFTRDSSRLIDSATGVGRSVLSPPAALLYFQQSLTTGGYSGSEKPMKHAGRVMVAVSTDSGNPDETAPLIAVLDVGVAPSGRLAQLPDVIELRRIDAGTELRSELASIDAAGLTTWSALLGFTGCADGAFLLDGSDGKIALFFRDINGRFVSVAYFDTFTEPVRIGLTDQRGVEVASCLGSPALNAADLTIEVDDGDASTCTVTITSAGLQERWTAVPRARTKLARVLNGEAGTDYDFAGAVTIGAAPGNESSQARLLVPPAGLPTGSLLVRATTTPDSAARGSDPTVVDQQRSSLTHGARGWTAATPGQALRVGKGCFASAPPTVPGARFDAVDDMTMEVWLQPQLGVGRGRLAERRAATVFRFEPDGFVQIDVAPHLDVAGTITIEAWVRIDKRPTNIRNIVAHGHRFDPDGEVFLRLEGQWDLRYQVGSWDGAEHLTSFPVPDEDIGHWVHLAGVYGGDTWRLYRNGMQVSSRQDGTGAVRVENTPWQIGASSVATDRRGLEGWVDEVRIWSSARTDDEILEHLGRPLADPENEPALVGYWCGSSGAKDLSSHDATCREVGRVRCENAVLPELFDAREGVSIMRHASASTSGERLRSYELRLEARRDQLASKRQRTVIVLNGNSHIQIDPAAQLNFAGNITLEAWVQIEKPIDGFRNIVAHGYRRAPDREVFLRVHNMHYEVGSCDGRDHLTTCSVDAADLGRWVHLAGVYDGTHWRLYRDGIEASSQADATGAVEVLDSHWNIGASTQRSDPRYFVGRVDDVRIWSTARTAEQIRDHLGDPLAAPEKETTLAGNWCGSSGAKDVSRHHGTCRVLGPVRYEPQELPELFYAPNGIWPVAQVKGLRARSTTPLQGWGHVAATYAQSFAMDLTRGEYLECGDDAGLDLTDDLTVEVFGQIDELVGGNGLLVKGTPAPGTDARVPYSLVVDGKGLLQFAFQDVDGVVHTFGAEKPIVPGSPFRVAASRKRQTSTVGQGIGTCVVVWHDIALRVEDANGSTFTTTRHYTHPKVTIVDGKPSIAASNQEHALEPAAVGGGAEHLVIGRGYLDLDEKRRVPLHGRVSEVRIWNAACESISARVSGGVSGLASYWRFAERAGPTVADSAGSAHARLIGAARWCRDPDPRGSTLRLYLDGVELPSRTEQFEGLPGEVPFVLFARQSASADGDDGFTGGIDELRLWRVVRTAKELRDNMFRRVIGEDSDQLIAYYPFEIAPAGENAPSGVVTLADRSGTGNDLELHAARFAPSDAPVGDEAPQVCNALAPVRTAYVETTRARPAVAEYGEMTTDATGKLVGVLKRCYSLVRPDGSWKLVAGFKVGDLTTEWVSQVQFAPQLIGYIEGAPPVPRENLGQRAVPGIGDIDDYNEASAVRLLEADSTRLTHSVSLDRGFDQQWDIALGAVLRAEGAAGFGYEQKLFETESFVGLHTKFENSYSWLEESIAEAVQTTRKETSLELRGRITPIGYLPDNVGLALVESETADLFALRLRRNNALVGYHLRPNADIPPDWNIVHFKLDPHYTKQGTLDGFVGNEPDDDYPNAGGSRSEASYYKPKEAYQLEQRIAEDEEAARMARFYDAAISAGPGGEALPDLTKRNIVNTYVWTADGGLFAETQEVMDSVHEVKGGAYKFLGMAGLKAELLFSAPAGMKFSLDALMGGHHNRVKSRTKEATHAFSLDVSVDKVERDIYERTGDGQLKESREPGKVDAYRFMTFYLEPSDRNFEDFFGRVVDPAWIELNDPAALTLRQLRDASEKPACWRVFHRVTFVSRVLRESDAEPRSLEEKLPRLDIDSNYELVRQLEPYLVPATWQTTAELRQAVEAALEAVHLEELLGNSAEIAEFMEQYLAARAPGAPAIEC
ncbi:MAG: LamG-like jellyroll fold domain-containing protein [Acidimicrobiia bacterium]